MHLSSLERIPVAERHELEIMPIAIYGRGLELYGIKDWDPFVNNLMEKGDECIKEFPFWVKIWEASIVLACHLIQLGLEKEKEVLEIGAGMGVTGLFLGAFGHRVTITDCEEDALELLRMNVKQNRLNGVSVRKLDWNYPDLPGKYDIICGSELVYTEACIEPLVNLFGTYLKPGGAVYLSHDFRRKCIMKFIGMVPGRFDITTTHKTLKGDAELYKILIHKLRPK